MQEIKLSQNVTQICNGPVDHSGAQQLTPGFRPVQNTNLKTQNKKEVKPKDYLTNLYKAIHIVKKHKLKDDLDHVFFTKKSQRK